MLSEVTQYAAYQLLMTGVTHADDLIGVTQIVSDSDDFITWKTG